MLRRAPFPTALAAVLGIVILGFAFPDAALAQSDDFARTDGKSVYETIVDGGVPEFIIILLSVIGMALIIEHSVNLTRDKLIPPYFMQELEGLLDEEEYDEAMDLCDHEDNVLSRVISATLSKIPLGHDRMTLAAMDASEEESTLLHHRISYLSLIATVAPMLGLLGTVLGMIQAFNMMAIMDNPPPRVLAGGISQALVTTCTGLIVAIPVMVAYMYFRNRSARVVQEVECITQDVVDRFRPLVNDGP